MSHTKVGDWADLGRCAWVEKGDTVRVRGQVWVTAVSCMIVERAEVAGLTRALCVNGERR